MITGADNVRRNIKNIADRKLIATVALCNYYAGYAQQKFRERQASNAFWNNQTNTAYNQVFGESFLDGNDVGWFLSHAVKYGVYLELANDRKHEALRPIVQELLPEFEKDLIRIWE